MSSKQDSPAPQESRVDGKPFFAYVIPSCFRIPEGSMIQLYPFQLEMIQKLGTLPRSAIEASPPNPHTGE